MKPSGKKARRWRRAGIAAAILGVTPFIAWYLLGFAEASADLEHQLAAAKREGLALVPADLRIGPRIMPEENSAGEIRLVANAIHERHYRLFSSDLDFDRRYEVDEGSLATRQALLADAREVEPVFDQIRSAVRKPHLDFGYQWELGCRLAMPELVDIKQMVRGLALAARIEAKEGNPQKAFADLQTAADLASRLQEDKTFLGLLVRARCDKDILSALRSSSDRWSDSPSLLKTARLVVNSLGPTPDLRHSVGAEVVMVRSTIDQLADPSGKLWHNVETSTSDYVQSTYMSQFIRYRPFRRAFESRTIEQWRWLWNHLPKDPEDFVSVRQACRGFNERAEAKASSGLSYRILCELVPGVSGDFVLEDVALRRAVSTGIKILQSHFKDRAWPSVIAGSEKSNLDPFTGEALLTRRTPKGFVVYSVGPNLKDDGGLHRYVDDDTNGDDICFEPGRLYHSYTWRKKHPK